MGKYWRDLEHFEQFEPILVRSKEQLEELLTEAKTLGKCRRIEPLTRSWPNFVAFEYRTTVNGELDYSEYDYFCVDIARILNNIGSIRILLEELSLEEMLFSESSDLRSLGKALVEFMEKHQK